MIRTDGSQKPAQRSGSAILRPGQVQNESQHSDKLEPHVLTSKYVQKQAQMTKKIDYVRSRRAFLLGPASTPSLIIHVNSGFRHQSDTIAGGAKGTTALTCK